MSTESQFVTASVGHLLEEYLPRIAQALEILPESDLWWRPHPESTTVGNLLLHLEGNVRQWILSGFGDTPDRRERAGEFSSEDGHGARELLVRLRETVTEACALIETMDEGTLTGPRRIQGFETTGLAAIYHVVEHFSWHTGQIVWIAKYRAGQGHGLAFYDEAKINSAKNS